MSTLSERPSGPTRPSSHLRDSAATDLHVRFAAAETVVRRRLRQLAAVEAALRSAGIEVPLRRPIEPFATPRAPSQFAADGESRRSRSTEIVRKSVARLKAGTCRSRSPSKAEIVAISRHRDIDPAGRGVSRNVFRTNQDCLDLFIDACLPFDADRRRRTSTPSWAVRMERNVLIGMVVAAEANRDELTRQVMRANELLIGLQVAAIRRDVVRKKAERMLVLND